MLIDARCSIEQNASNCTEHPRELFRKLYNWFNDADIGIDIEAGTTEGTFRTI